MTSQTFLYDIDGAKVYVGDTVKVLEIDPAIKPEPDELERVMSMLGEEFEVEEIDEYGCAWVTKWWPITESEIDANGISLSSNQMKLVRSSNGG